MRVNKVDHSQCVRKKTRSKYDYDRTNVWNSSRGKGQGWRNGREKSSPSRKQEVVPDGES